LEHTLFVIYEDLEYLCLMEHQDTRRLPRSAQEALRQKVVRAVVVKKMTQRAVARFFEVSENAVSTWVRAYKAKGGQALRTKRLGRPKGTALTAEQAASIRKSVVGKCPDQSRLPGMLWTREAVSALVERRFGIQLSRWTMGRHMKSWGLTAQKPAKRALEQNPAQVRYWLQTKYPAICRQAKEEKAQIWWGDETGLRSDHQTGTTWGEKGRTPVVRQSGKRISCNIVSAITNQGKMAFMVFEQRFTADIFLNFLQRLVSHQERKTFLILDRYSVHTSSKVLQWVESQKEKISVFFLPTHSPELNPDELLNQDLKSNALRSRRPGNKAELMSKTRSFLRGKQRQPHKVAQYFEGKNGGYAKTA
jgi:transposase